MSQRVLVTRRLPPGAIAPLSTLAAEVVYNDDDAPLSRSELVRAAARSDGIVCLLTDQIDAEVISAGKGRLRVVANVAAGYDNVDVRAAAEVGVTICNTPGVLDEATADITFMLLLSAARRATEAEAYLRAGQWNGWQLNAFLGKELRGATLGLVGYGRIGQAVSRRAAGFGMRTLHYTRSNSGAKGWVSDLDELLAVSDFVSLHVPLTNATHHLIDARRIALMKPDAVLINTARGPVIDEAALAEALTSGHLFAAGLDVYEAEPCIHPDLLVAPRTVLLPHIGSATVATRTRMAQMACQAVADVLSGRTPTNAIDVPVA